MENATLEDIENAPPTGGSESGNRAGSGDSAGGSEGRVVYGWGRTDDNGKSLGPSGNGKPNGANGNASATVGSGESSTKSGDSGTGSRTGAGASNGGSSGRDDRGVTAGSGGAGTGKRGRGRPRKQPDEMPSVGEDAGRPLSIGLPKPNKKRPLANLDERTVAHGICALFGGVALWTRHRHWTKTTEQVKPISEPLTAMLNELPKEIVDRIERFANPALFAYGCFTVVGPDLMVEMKVRELEAKVARGEIVIPPSNNGPATPAATPEPGQVPPSPVITPTPNEL